MQNHIDENVILKNQIKALHLNIEEMNDEISYFKKLFAQNEFSKEASLLIESINNLTIMLNHHRNSSIGGRIKSFFKPKIGNLYQYQARKLKIPTRYNKTPAPDTQPKISIVTPSFNQGAFIEDTIKSVLDQKYPSLEYIIQDGNSNDDSVFTIQRYTHNLKHWESKKDSGQSNAINLGFQHATGDIMAYLNSDDLLLPGSLNYIARFFEKKPDVDVVYGHRVCIDKDNREIGRWVLPPHQDEILSWVDYIPQETLFWRRSIWDKIGGSIDENFRFAMDWDLILRFREANAKFVRLPRFLGAFRIHDQQKTSTEIVRLGQQEMNTLRKRANGRRVYQSEIHKKIRPYQILHLMCHKLYKLGIFRY